MTTTIIWIAIALLWIGLIIGVPFLGLWAISLLGVPVVYSFWTWLGMAILLGFVSGGIKLRFKANG